MRRFLLIAPLLLCAMPARAAISFISDCESATTGCTPATRAVGDLIITFAYKASLTAPSAPTGYTAITGCSASASTSSQNCACRIATNTASDAVAWTSTVGVVVVVYRGQRDTVTCTNNKGGVANSTGASTTLTYPAITMSVGTGTSWVFGAAGQTTATNLSTNGTPAGVTQRVTSGANAVATGWDTNAGVASAGAKTATITSANRWRSMQLEILAPIPDTNIDSGPGCYSIPWNGGTTSMSTTGIGTFSTSGNPRLIVATVAWHLNNNTLPASTVGADGTVMSWTRTVEQMSAASPSSDGGAEIFIAVANATLTQDTFTMNWTGSTGIVGLICLYSLSSYNATQNGATASNTGGTNAEVTLTPTVTGSNLYGGCGQTGGGAGSIDANTTLDLLYSDGVIGARPRGFHLTSATASTSPTTYGVNGISATAGGACVGWEALPPGGAAPTPIWPKRNLRGAGAWLFPNLGPAGRGSRVASLFPSSPTP